MSIATRFYDTLEKAERDYGVKVTSKDQKHVWLWKLIDRFLKAVTFGKMTTFLTQYTTTLGRTVYYPEGWKIEEIGKSDYVILCHEIKHVKQQYELGNGFFPLGALAFALLYLFVPLPIGFAYFRWKFEREAYRISWYTALEVGLKPDLDFYVDALSGSNYLWTWVMKNQVRKWFTDHCQTLAPVPEE